MFKLEKFLLSYWRKFSLRNQTLPYRVRGSTKEEEYPKSKKGCWKIFIRKILKNQYFPNLSKFSMKLFNYLFAHLCIYVCLHSKTKDILQFQWSVIKRPTDSNTSTTGGQTSTTRGQMSTKSGKTSGKSGKTSATSGQTSTTSEQTSTTSE